MYVHTENRMNNEVRNAQKTRILLLHTAKMIFLVSIIVGVIWLAIFGSNGVLFDSNFAIGPNFRSRLTGVADNGIIEALFNSDPTTVMDDVDDLIDDDTLFLYKAYYETRSEVPTIRLSLNGRCDAVGDMDTLIEVNGKVLNTTHEAVTGGCPDGWAGGCKYNAFDVISENYTGPVPKEITVHRGNRTARMPVVPVPTEFPLGLTVYRLAPSNCFHGTVKTARSNEIPLLSPYNVAECENVKKVLDYYVKEGTADVRPWPLMPFSDSLDPNNSTYQLMEHLVEHDCSFRSTTKYTAMNDIDEFLFPFNGKLIDFLEETHNRTKDADHYNPYNFEKNPFSGLLKPIVVRKGGPGKVIYLTQFTKVQQTHLTRRFFGKHKQYAISDKKALLMHARNSFADFVLNKTSEFEANLFPDNNGLFHQQRIAKVTKTIFGDVTPSYFHRAAEALEDCVKNWRGTMNNCKIPITGCQDKMDPVEDWIYTKADENSRYTVL